MFRLLRSQVFWGVVILSAGILSLLEVIFDFEFGSIFWSLMFGLGALFFFTIYYNNRMNWWALIPGFALLGIGLTILSSVLFPAADALSGSFVLGAIGVSFISVYLADRRFWWAIIPAGVMFTLVAVILLEPVFSDIGTGGVFFFGLGITFGVLALIPTQSGRMGWAWIPAVALILMGAFIIGAAEQAILYIGPLALIVGGVFLILRTFLRRS